MAYMDPMGMENGPFEEFIVDLPIKNGHVPQLCKRLPEATPIDRWFISWEIPLKWMIQEYTHGLETSIWQSHILF